MVALEHQRTGERRDFVVDDGEDAAPAVRAGLAGIPLGHGRHLSEVAA